MAVAAVTRVSADNVVVVEPIGWDNDPTIQGDLTGDSRITIEDITTMVALLNGKLSVYELPVPSSQGDLNGDGKIDKSDVTALQKLLLRK